MNYVIKNAKVWSKLPACSRQAVIRQELVHLVRWIYSLPERTVFDWLSRYRAGGWDALKKGKRSGRPGKLSAEDMQWVYKAVTMGNPMHYQYDFCLWTLGLLGALIEQARGIKLSKGAVSRLLVHLGLSAPRPAYKFIQFLKKRHKDAGRSILVIADNAKYHYSKETRRFLKQQDGEILLAFLPAYSPELNPDLPAAGR